MNPSSEYTAKRIIRYYKTDDISTTQACQDAIVGLGNICNHKTLYHISRGQKASPRVEYALRKLYKTIPPIQTDTRPGAIRIDFENGTDPHEARALIIEKLSTKERGEKLLREAKEKSTR